MGKDKIAHNEQFLLFPWCFLLDQKVLSRFVNVFDIISLIVAEFEKPTIGISGKGLILTIGSSKHKDLWKTWERKKGNSCKKQFFLLTQFSFYHINKLPFVLATSDIVCDFIQDSPRFVIRLWCPYTLYLGFGHSRNCRIAKYHLLGKQQNSTVFEKIGFVFHKEETLVINSLPHNPDF